MGKEWVVLVDHRDREIGVEEKMRAHLQGLLHRAFSIFIFNPAGEMLLQRRALHKYHSPGLWSNACCSHPRPKEHLLEAVVRRLREELGISCPLKKISHLLYRAKLAGGLIEHEFDHIFMGIYNGQIRPNPAEIVEVAWMKVEHLLSSVRQYPERYTAWFKMILQDGGLLGRMLAELQNGETIGGTAVEG